MLYIKIMLSLLAIIGLFISLGEMLGRFIDKDRTDFTKIMETQLEGIDQKKPVIVYYKTENKSKKMQLLTIYNTVLTRKDYRLLRSHISVVFGGI